jgi:hypothetical protein
MIHFRIRYERLRDRLDRRRRRVGVARALWLALLPPLLILAFSPVLSLGSLAALAAFTLTLVCAGYWLTRPVTTQALGQLLDSRYGLDDLLVTALEVDRRGPASPLEQALLDDAASAVARIEKGPGLFAGAAERELETAFGLVAILVGVWLLAGSQAGLVPEHWPGSEPGSDWWAVRTASQLAQPDRADLADADERLRNMNAPPATPEPAGARRRLPSEGEEVALGATPGSVPGDRRDVQGDGEADSGGSFEMGTTPSQSVGGGADAGADRRLREIVRRYFAAAEAGRGGAP